MKNILKLLTIATCLAGTQLTQAQDSPAPTEQNANTRFWEAELPGGSYIVALSRISSVSMSSYYVKGAVVHEVDIETNGSALTRIYAIEALGENGEANVAKNLISRGSEIVKEAGKKAGVNTDTSVHKEYPITTHSKTIEFRVADKKDLEQLYKSLSKSWKSNRGRKFTIE